MADNTMDIVTLRDIDLGRSATVAGFTSDAPARRLLEMGFVPGTKVTALRAAPLGDPIEYAVMGGRVAMRQTDAASILIEAPN